MNSQSSSSLTANHRFLKFHNDDDEQVKIILHDLCQIGNLWDPNIVSEFYNKMRKCKRKIPFSLEFQLVASIELKDVIEVRISHSLNCLVALSSDEYTFSFFDLKTLKKLGIFVAKEEPSYFHVEENYDGNNNDALVYGAYDSVVKYDLKTVLEKQGASNYIWQQSAICNARGIVSSRDCYSSNIIYVCYVDHENQIAALNSKTGEVLYKIDKNHNGIQLDDLSGIDITNTNDTLFVAQNGHIRKLQRCPSSETILWQSELLFGQDHVKRSDGLAFDTVSRHVLVCDTTNDGIGVFTERGQFVTFVGGKGDGLKQFKNPTGLCLDEQTGTLYVADSSNHRIQIFQ